MSTRYPTQAKVRLEWDTQDFFGVLSGPLLVGYAAQGGALYAADVLG